MKNNIMDVMSFKYKNSGYEYGVGETYDSIIWHSHNTREIPSQQELDIADAEYTQYLLNTQYIVNRKKEYPSIEDQLDVLYNLGYDGWKNTIKVIKDKYPPPSQEV